jgi:cytochrome c556
MQLIELGSQLQADAPLVLAIRKMEDFAAQQIKRLEGEKGAEKGVRADAVPNIDKLISDYKGDMQAFAKGRADIDVLQKEIKSAQDGLAGAERLVAELLLREESDAAVKQMNACLEEIGKLVKKTNEFITSISSRA